jgi:AcrR family transcriptional regulator
VTALSAPQRIVQIATALFAEHGFDGVSTREIAAAAGLNIATVNYHVGGKRDLYRLVFARMSQLERERIERTLHSVESHPMDTPDGVRALLRRVAQMLVELTVEHPETARLWVRRWLDHDGDADVEIEASVPVYRMFQALVGRIEAESGYRYAGPSLELFLKSVSWMLHGYALSGPLDWNSGRGRADDPHRLAELTDFLADYFTRMFDLPATGRRAAARGRRTRAGAATATGGPGEDRT